LERKFDEKVNDRMKIAIVTSVLPATIQDHVFQAVNEAMTYHNMIAKVSSWVSNMIAMGGMPMDIGEVEEAKWYCEDNYGEFVVVSAWTQCHSCYGYGHISKDCPNRSKGKGKCKDTYGKAKGNGKENYNNFGNYYGKSNGKDSGKGGFNKGGCKGYQGTCCSCGKVGHKAW
jgi:hypothetical protein